jgi:hypothetical protein
MIFRGTNTSSLITAVGKNVQDILCLAVPSLCTDVIDVITLGILPISISTANESVIIGRKRRGNSIRKITIV